MPQSLPVCRPLTDEDDEGEVGEEDEGGGVREHCRGEEVEEEEDADRDLEEDEGRGKEVEGERGARDSTYGNNHTNNNNYNREPPLLSFSRLIVRALVGEYVSAYYYKYVLILVCVLILLILYVARTAEFFETHRRALVGEFHLAYTNPNYELLMISKTSCVVHARRGVSR
jgi:hypothetical protein